MRIRTFCAALAAAGAIALGLSGCTSTQTSTGVSAPSSQKCQIQLSNAPSSFTDAGGSGSLSVATTRDCGWSATANASWIAMTSSSGQGDASISYSVAANAVPQTRVASITVEGQTVQLSQAAAPCRYSINKSADAAGPSGGTLSVALTTLSGCGWTTSSDSGWLAITSNPSGNASGIVGLTIAANTGSPRVGHALIAGQTYTVTQAAGAAPAPAPPTTPAPPLPAPGPVQISGTASSVSGHCPDISFILSGSSVVTSTSTVFTGGKCGDVKDGRSVTVSGTQESSGSIAATAVDIDK